jgi:hypothetical protein
LHQKELGGEKDWPLDLDSFVDAHAETFVRAHTTGAG